MQRGEQLGLCREGEMGRVMGAIDKGRGEERRGGWPLRSHLNYPTEWMVVKWIRGRKTSLLGESKALDYSKD